jgi:hypothetical protein
LTELREPGGRADRQHQFDRVLHAARLRRRKVHHPADVLATLCLLVSLPSQALVDVHLRARAVLVVPDMVATRVHYDRLVACEQPCTLEEHDGDRA